MSDIALVGAFSSGARMAWRGMRSIDYALVSSLHRFIPHADEAQLRAEEKRTLAEARQWGLGSSSSGWSSDLQLLADLQHFGTSTRLLDVTSNPMTALWFAAQQLSDEERRTGFDDDGVLLAINVAEWPRFGRTPPTSLLAGARPLSWELTEALASRRPFVVDAHYPNDRLRAQEGFFISATLPEQDPRTPFRSIPLELPHTTGSLATMALAHVQGALDRDELPPRFQEKGLLAIPFMAFHVRASAKQRILDILKNSYNRSASVLFPDFAGFREFAESARPRTSPQETDAKR
ncbi:FRG domain-containing protein [Microbacterium sp. NPDC056736]|uniref:FRG domain-containing protein n=1 Tax=Microbacterium sp. NPDC056736 TaxID=3345932 RepID=UPI00366C05DB